MKKWLVLIGILIAGGIGFFAWQSHRVNQNLEKAKLSLENGEFSRARVYAQKVLSSRPNHHESLLIHAEAVFKDQTLDSSERVEAALASLEKIPDQGEVGYEARVYEASIYFFNLLKPSAAERSLQRATTIFSDRLDVYLSLMQIYCCTQRQTFAEPVFLRAIVAAKSREEKYRVLSDWFLSQFSLNTYNSRADKLLHTAGLYAENVPASQKRLMAFRDASPDEFQYKVALAYWFYLRNDPEHAKTLLDQLDADSIELGDPLYLTTTVNVLFEVGEIELARELHTYWKDDVHFEYWRQKGVLEQDYENDPLNAALSLERALKVWPGAIDPSVYFRLESCAKLNGNEQNAEKYQRLGEQIRNTTNVKRIKEMQNLLLNNDQSIETLKKFASFYGELGRELERNQWEELAAGVK